MAELLKIKKVKSRGELIDSLLKEILTPAQYKDCYNWYYSLLDGFGIELLMLAKDVGVDCLLVNNKKPKKAILQDTFSAANDALFHFRGLPKHIQPFSMSLGKVITVPERKRQVAEIMMEDMGSDLEESATLKKMSDVGPLERAIPMGYDI